MTTSDLRAAFNSTNKAIDSLPDPLERFEINTVFHVERQSALGVHSEYVTAIGGFTSTRPDLADCLAATNDAVADLHDGTAVAAAIRAERDLVAAMYASYGDLVAASYNEPAPTGHHLDGCHAAAYVAATSVDLDASEGD